MPLETYSAQESYRHQRASLKRTFEDAAADTTGIITITNALMQGMKQIFIRASILLQQGAENLWPTQRTYSFVYVLNRSSDRPQRY